MGTRIDADLMRAIYKEKGLSFLMEYQKKPLVDVGHCGDWLEGEMWFPFDRAVYRAKYSMDDFYFSVDSLGACLDELPVIKKKYPMLPENWGSKGLVDVRPIAVVNEEELLLFPVTGLWMDLQEGMAIILGPKVGEGGLTEKEHKQVQSVAQWVGRYLFQTEKKLVETRQQVHAPGSLTRRQQKEAVKKPFLREDLPTVILIDPRDTLVHGRSVPQGGTHASPVPHQRRGHFRVLKHARYKEPGKVIPVASSWVGDSEWVYNGNEYRVLPENKR